MNIIGATAAEIQSIGAGQAGLASLASPSANLTPAV